MLGLPPGAASLLPGQSGNTWAPRNWMECCLHQLHGVDGVAAEKEPGGPAQPWNEHGKHRLCASPLCTLPRTIP